MVRIISGAALALALATPAVAQPAGQTEPSREVQLRPILDARLRYEHVDQPGLNADALTLRLRGGFEARYGPFAFLAEGEAVVAPVARYNAFAFPLPNARQRRPQFAVVPDPENVELNRLQLQYRAGGALVTLGRQRINLDDQRWVGAVGWRQNEQTFDSLRVEARLGPVHADVAYANSQRTVFGREAGPRMAFRGNFLLAGVAARLGPLEGKVFAYLLDYDEAFVLANSSQTYGVILSDRIPLGAQAGLALRASYARQSDYGRNPSDYAAAYWSFEGTASFAEFALGAGWERLGSDHGRAVQTPMATLHKFNGWADLFLTTPPAGLEDAYVSIGRRFEPRRPVPGLEFGLAFHRFRSAIGGRAYGSEWDASAGIRLGRVALLANYADYDARRFGADTRKFWLQAEWAF